LVELILITITEDDAAWVSIEVLVEETVCFTTVM